MSFSNVVPLTSSSHTRKRMIGMAGRSVMSHRGGSRPLVLRLPVVDFGQSHVKGRGLPRPVDGEVSDTPSVPWRQSRRYLMTMCFIVVGVGQQCVSRFHAKRV